MRKNLVLALALTLSGMTACDQIMGPSDGPELAQPAEAILRSGDLPGAMAKYEELAGQHPDSAYVGMGQAYMYVLSGQTAKADQVLAKFDVERDDPKLAAEIKLRRALVALSGGVDELDKVKQFGQASGLPGGQLLAAEVYLIDADPDSAIPLLQSAQGAGGKVAATATKYLELVQSDDPVKPQLAEATALWALGSRDVAVETAEDLLKNLPAEDEMRPPALLLWAGRAASVGRSDIANGLLDEITEPPAGQAWRIEATRAIAMLAEGKEDEGIAKLVALAQGGAPTDGLADAIATASGASGNKQLAMKISAGLESNAIARGLLSAGAPRAAQGAAPEGTLKRYLETQ